ncbi:MAG: hypothetical protein J5J00_00760 [Deltaproteobacteria bacterium]|nr:hypothetical protein [Deltaproteobacteria bacterium]
MNSSLTNSPLTTCLKDGRVWVAESPGITLPQVKESYSANFTERAPFKISAIDNELQGGGIQCGQLHEWFGATAWGTSSWDTSRPPLTILASLFGNLISNCTEERKGFSKVILWIGKECWPSPYLLAQCHGSALFHNSLLQSSLFIDPAGSESRKWCFETALRSPAVAAAVCYLKGVNLTLSRRFAIAAKMGGALGALIRPEKESGLASAAATRWIVRSVRSPTPHPRWELNLLKQKGKQPNRASWIIESHEEQKISLHIPSDVADQSRAEEKIKKSA